MPEPKALYTVMQLADGTLYVDWCPELQAVVDPDGKDTDVVLDNAERLLNIANEEATQSAE